MTNTQNAADQFTSILDLVMSDYRDPATGDTYPMPLLRIERARLLHELLRRIDQALVDDARAAGHSWQEIAGALGVTRQSAHARYGGTHFRREPSDVDVDPDARSCEESNCDRPAYCRLEHHVTGASRWLCSECWTSNAGIFYGSTVEYA